MDGVRVFDTMVGIDVKQTSRNLLRARLTPMELDEDTRYGVTVGKQNVMIESGFKLIVNFQL